MKFIYNLSFKMPVLTSDKTETTEWKPLRAEVLK